MQDGPAHGGLGFKGKTDQVARLGAGAEECGIRGAFFEHALGDFGGGEAGKAEGGKSNSGGLFHGEAVSRQAPEFHNVTTQSGVAYE